LAAKLKNMNWIDISEKLPQKAGWYSAAIVPVNHDSKNPSNSNDWRESFGFSKVWFNPDAVYKWWEPDDHGHGSKAIDKRVTHWADLPKVPML
jgi:hypothetical protein